MCSTTSLNNAVGDPGHGMRRGGGAYIDVVWQLRAEAGWRFGEARQHSRGPPTPHPRASLLPGRQYLPRCGHTTSHGLAQSLPHIMCPPLAKG